MTNTAIKPTGLSYIGDEGAISVYRLQLDGLHLLDVLVDNATTIDPEVAEATGVKLKDETATLHPIAVATPDRKAVLPTNGYGAKYAHIENEGVSAPHIDGISVQQYVMPRVVRLLGLLLQARSAL